MSDAMTLYKIFEGKVAAVLAALEAEGVLPEGTNTANVAVEPPREASHGDLATNAAMVLAKQAKTNPRMLKMPLNWPVLQIGNLEQWERRTSG